jgi:hypothetical protein
MPLFDTTHPSSSALPSPCIKPVLIRTNSQRRAMLQQVLPDRSPDFDLSVDGSPKVGQDHKRHRRTSSVTFKEQPPVLRIAARRHSRAKSQGGWERFGAMFLGPGLGGTSRR